MSGFHMAEPFQIHTQKVWYLDESGTRVSGVWMVTVTECSFLRPFSPVLRLLRKCFENLYSLGSN